MEARDLKESMKEQENLTEALVRKWASKVKGLPKDRARGLALVMESTQVAVKNRRRSHELQEDTTSDNAGGFTKYIFPMLRRVWTNMISPEIMSLQPMSSSMGAVFFMEMKHQSEKGTITGGENMSQVLDRNYSSEYTESVIGTGTGAQTLFSAILKWTPIRPNSGTDNGIRVTVKAGAEILYDNGSGALSGVAGGTGTINYTTGAISVTFNAAPANDVPVQVLYYYNSENNHQIPEMYLAISRRPIEAKTRKLKAVWSPEAVDDLRDAHGVDMETEAVSAFANQATLEIDRENIDLLLDNAQFSAEWEFDMAVHGDRELAAIRSLYTVISAVSAKIQKSTKRGQANFIVVPPEVLALMDQLGTHADFKPATPAVERAPSYGAIASDTGIYLAGTLSNKYRVFVDPYLDENSAIKRVLVGLKGRDFYDAGAAYCPYVPLEIVGALTDPSNLETRMAMRTRYANVVLRPDYYGVIEVDGLPTVG